MRRVCLLTIIAAGFLGMMGTALSRQKAILSFEVGQRWEDEVTMKSKDPKMPYEQKGSMHSSVVKVFPDGSALIEESSPQMGGKSIHFCAGWILFRSLN